MAKEFVRKILNVSTIQNLRDWTNCLGDIILKDGIYAYIRVEGEYKPISYPMIYDYQLPKQKWVHSDFYQDKYGIHGLDRLDNTIKEYNLTDGEIVYNDHILDPSTNISQSKEIDINKNGIKDRWHSDKNEFTEDLTPWYYDRSINIHDNDDVISNITEQLNSTTYKKNINTNNVTVINTVTDNVDWELNTNYSTCHIECSPKTQELMASVAQYGLQATIKENSLRVIHLAQNSSYIENLTNNNFRFNLQLQNNNLAFEYKFDGTNVNYAITGDTKSYQAYANAYDKLLGLTEKISNLQGQINSLSSRITNLENKG